MSAIPNWQTAVMVCATLVGGPIALVVVLDAVIDWALRRDRR